MKVAVTGASGFIGRHLVEALIDRGVMVKGLAINTKEAKVVDKLGAETVTGDIRDYKILERLVRNTEIVFHLAAKVKVTGRWKDFKSITVDGTINTLRAAAKNNVSRFVLFSSIAVYDNRFQNTNRRITETAPVSAAGDRNFGLYGRAKFLAEKLATKFSKIAALPYTIIRPGWVYGPDDNTILPYIVKYLDKPKVTRVRNLNPVMPFIYVKDLADCTIMAALNEAGANEVFNVMSMEDVGLDDYFSLVVNKFGLNKRQIEVPFFSAKLFSGLSHICRNTIGLNLDGGMSRWATKICSSGFRYDASKARTVLGWQPKTPLEKGLETTAEWWKRNV